MGGGSGIMLPRKQDAVWCILGQFGSSFVGSTRQYIAVSHMYKICTTFTLRHSMDLHWYFLL